MIMAELFSMHNLKEKVTPKSVHFLVITDKKFILMLSYLSKFQLLKCIQSQENRLQRSPKFGISAAATLNLTPKAKPG